MLSSCLRISASSECVADSIISDFDTLIRIIEDTQPDPYTNHGGRVFYHKHAYDIRNELLSDSNLTVNTLYKKASQFISQLQDEMGAIVAGETSSQAPNCYMEVTPFTLPYSGLSGSVSNTMQEFLPATDPKARELTPDIRLDYEDYLHLGFDSNSILLHLLSIDKQ